ncbi:MAG: tyrosine-type recombinase/integrase [Solirubrobacteraceae bacterium]
MIRTISTQVIFRQRFTFCPPRSPSPRRLYFLAYEGSRAASCGCGPPPAGIEAERNKSGPATRKRPGPWFYAALEAAGLGDKRTGAHSMVFHDLRHTFGTLAVEAWPLHDVQAYMGHADIQTTMIYVHHQPKAAAADKLSQLVAAATAPVPVAEISVRSPLARTSAGFSFAGVQVLKLERRKAMFWGIR